MSGPLLNWAQRLYSLSAWREFARIDEPSGEHYQRNQKEHWRPRKSAPLQVLEVHHAPEFSDLFYHVVLP